MRVKIGSLRLETDAIDAYRVETTTSDPLVRVFLSSGEYICISTRYENMKIEEIVKVLDDAFLTKE